jgi:hypothetical protein
MSIGSTKTTACPPWWPPPERVMATCRHEAGHAIRGHLLGFCVTKVWLDHSGGTTEVSFHLRPSDLASAYRRWPWLAAGAMQEIIETVLAGPCINRQPVQGDDLALLAAWRCAWPLRAHVSWARLYSRAKTAVAHWVREAATQTAVSILAHKLCRAPEYCLEGPALRAALETATAVLPKPQTAAPPVPKQAPPPASVPKSIPRFAPISVWEIPPPGGTYRVYQGIYF